MKLNKISVGLILVTTAAASFGGTLPHVELVKQYLESGKYKETLAGCKTRPMSTSASFSSPELQCWAANAASDLQKEPDGVRKLVLDGKAQDLALSRCKALSMEQRFKSVECAAAIHANDFVSFRLPRSIDTLKPVTFKR